MKIEQASSTSPAAKEQMPHPVEAQITDGTSPGTALVAHLRQHPGDVKLTTDEIIAMTRGE